MENMHGHACKHLPTSSQSHTQGPKEGGEGIKLKEETETHAGLYVAAYCRIGMLCN